MEWKTQTCKFGWWVDGIFTRSDGSEIQDGSDINTVDVDSSRQYCVTGDDEGNVNLFRLPVRKVLALSYKLILLPVYDLPVSDYPVGHLVPAIRLLCACLRVNATNGGTFLRSVV